MAGETRQQPTLHPTNQGATVDLHDERVNKAVGGLIVFAVLYMIYHIIRAILRG